MAVQRTTLADALERIRNAAKNDVIRTSEMSRTDRERAQAAGWLHPIINGWYIVGSEAAAQTGSTVFWYSHFWQFVQRYLEERFGDAYCLNAEASVDLHVASTTVPRHLIVITRDGGATHVQLPHETSIQTYPDTANLPANTSTRNGIQVMPLAVALSRVMPQYFRANPVNAEIALNMVNESELSRALITGRNTRAASRLMGAYRFLGAPDKADRIKKDMQPGVARISPVNPFKTRQPVLGSLPRVRLPHVARLRALWKKMRPDVIKTAGLHFPEAQQAVNAETYLANLEDIYQHDAYNSLSIEGYRVTPALIDRVRNGDWDPDREEDRVHVAAMAAKGYFDAFTLVKHAVQTVLQGTGPAAAAQAGLQDWYRALFGASVQAGILDGADLAGYRNRTVYIRGSMHVPPPDKSLMDCMDTYFELLAGEESAATRAVLGHFMFVFIHPYPDGNGRLGRFLMNLMLASGGYPWTVIRLEQRDKYMNSLEQASAKQNIEPFTRFIAQEMKVDWSKPKRSSPNSTNS